MTPELHAIVVGLWWLAGPFVALAGTFVIVRELLRPPRHVQDLIARVDRIETARAREQAKLVRLASVVRAHESDLQGMTTAQHDAIVVPRLQSESCSPAGNTVDNFTVGSAPGADPGGGGAAPGEPGAQPGAHVSTLRLLRPPSEPDIVATLRRAGRPLTRAQLAEALDRDPWQVTTEVRQLMLAGAVAMCSTGHDTAPAYQVGS